MIVLPECTVREWRLEDAASLAQHANDRRIWLNMRDAFPHPYTIADATAFLGIAVAMQPRTWFAVTVDDRAVGGIGYTLHGDVERIASRDRLLAWNCLLGTWHHDVGSPRSDRLRLSRTP